MMEPYFEDTESEIVIYHGRAEDIVPSLDPVDLILTDPPYGQTSLRWDRWPSGWCAVAVAAIKPTGSMWCFGTLRMFMIHATEFFDAGFALAQDIAGHEVDLIWEKHNGSGFHTDRFRRVHEQAAQFYLSGTWSNIYKDVQYTNDATARTVRRKEAASHWHGERKRTTYRSLDGGPRMMRSVLQVRSMHGKAKNETEKPVELILPMMNFACPKGGSVLDLFCGSGPVLEVAMATGRSCIGIDIREEQCEIAARRIMATPPPLFTESAPELAEQQELF